MSGKILASLLILVCLFGAPFALTYVTSCGTLSTAGETYVVNVALINNDSTCFTIAADDIILDCNGNTLNYTGSGGLDNSGVFIDSVDGVTVRNCIIQNWNAQGVRFDSATNLVIRNITTLKCQEGIRVYGASSYSIYASNIGFTEVGIYSQDGDDVSALVDGCTFDGVSTGTTGIAIYGNAATIRNNLVHSIERYCIRLGGDGAVYQVYNNTMYDCGLNAASGYTGGGVLLEGGVHNSVVRNNEVRDSGGYGYSDNYNFATNNTFHSNTAHDLYTVDTSPAGFYCTRSDGHISYNNSAWNIDGPGFALKCDNAEIYNNTATDCTENAFAIAGNNVEIYDNIGSRSIDGFSIDVSSGTGWLDMHDNIAHSNAENGFDMEGGGSTGLGAYPFADNLAWNNTRAGFYISPLGAFPLMSGNTARNNTIGVWFTRGTGGVFSDCDVYENTVGVAFTSTGATVDNCDIYNNRNTEPLGGTGIGVAFDNSYGNSVTDSRINGNQIGVFMNTSELDALDGCDVYDNSRQGIWMTGNTFSARILNTDSHENLGGTPPDGIYLDAEGNYPNLTMRNIRLYGNAGAALSMRNFEPSGANPAFTLEDSYVLDTMVITAGNSGVITDTYFSAFERSPYFEINLAGDRPNGIVCTNLGIGLPDSQSELGVGPDTTRYGYIVFPSVTLFVIPLRGDDVVLGTNFVSLVPTDSAPILEGPAEAHVKVDGCNGLKYYYLDGLPDNFDDIVNTGTEFTPAYSDCAGGWVMFATTHFTGYAAQGSAAPEEGGGEQYECITSRDCSPCEMCQDHVCVLPKGSCNTVKDCAGGSAYVNDVLVPSGLFLCERCSCISIECTTDSQCDEGYTCEDNECVPPECIQDSDCAEDEICVDFACQGKGGAEDQGGESGEQGNITPEQPPLPPQPPLITPVEIGQEVIPLVSPEEGVKPPEAGGIWQTITVGAAFVIGILVLGGLIYFLAAKKKKRKTKKEED